MPIKDPDGGLVWQGYDPRLIAGNLPSDQTATRPFYFGGSQVPTKGVTDVNLTGGAVARSRLGTSIPITNPVKVLPSIRK